MKKTLLFLGIALITAMGIEGCKSKEKAISSAPESETITFKKPIKGIINGNCRGCHSGESPPDGVNLESYAGVKKIADNGELVCVVTSGSGCPAMPPSGKLPETAIKQIQEWVQNGAPEE